MGQIALKKAVEATQLVALRDGTTVKELGEFLGLPRSTAHRLVAALAGVGLIERGEKPGRYVIGRLVGGLADGPLARRALRTHCRPHMDALRDATGETAGLHILHGGRRVLIDQSESQQQHRWVYSNPLSPMPLHAGAAAKMLLSLMPRAEAEVLLAREGTVAFTRSTPRNPALLLRELGRIGQQGYALSVEEVTLGISSVAVPVPARAAAHLPAAVMSLTGPSVRLTPRVLKEYLPQLRRAAARAAESIEKAVGRAPQAA